MSRMSKEFGLVLLGAGVLTAGYFTLPAGEDEMEAKAEEQAASRTGHHSGSHYRTGGMFIWIHSSGYAGSSSGRPAAYSSTSRAGGFGGVSRSFTGGGS